MKISTKFSIIFEKYNLSFKFRISEPFFLIILSIRKFPSYGDKPYRDLQGINAEM